MIHGRKSGTSGQHGYRRYSNKNEFNDIMNIKHGPWAEPSTLKNENGVSSNSFYGTPYFGETNTEVLVQEGNHAFFHCPVHNIRNQTVSPPCSTFTHYISLNLTHSSTSLTIDMSAY